MKKTYKKLLLGLAIIVGSGANSQTIYPYTGATETYTVPAGITKISIEANGSRGDVTESYSGGGATMYGEFDVSPGDVLTLYAGGNFTGRKSGGDGSWVENTTTSTLFIVAGGGGCGSHASAGAGAPVTNDGTASLTHPDYPDGAPGIDGHGGGAGVGPQGTGGGGGWFSAGADGLGSPGGLIRCMGSHGTDFAGGAGGRYSGGGGVDMDLGWGTGGGGAGGSYNIGTNQDNLPDNNAALGEITIDEICDPISGTVSTTTVCIGDSFTASASGDGTITWDGGLINDEPFTPESVGITTYTATSDDENECSFSIEIEVVELPTITTYIREERDFCEGEPVVIISSGADTYTWDGGIFDGEPFYPPAGMTTYTVIGLDTITGCENSASIDVFVMDPIVITAVTTLENIGYDGEIDITVTGGTPGYTFDWDIDGTGDYDDTEDLTGLTVGVYIVEVEDEIGCTGSLTVKLESQLGLFDDDEIVFSVYPNPTSDVITISTEGNFAYQVLSVNGAILSNGVGFNTTEVNLTDFAKGVYFVNLQANDQQQVLKVVKK
ncbi:T9SS type A sorting domain-containing protein [Crocinitomix catalasitica]|uniref:T9SS type A sorting domain-containing protein n=1 Tax=Crocinitomix catalasitica TaxID=184607 RepID=UPI000484B9A9|nr:T9SS type A sorting domain-containing protein [Crocinitomix catalasitica]